jgi:hypothetical protein
VSGMFGTDIEICTSKSVEWYTPAWVFDSLGIEFDLDPSSPHDIETVVPAKTKYNVFDNGLNKPWFGRVWLNPPYGKETPFWMRRMISHKNGIALVFSRTDTNWCQEAMRSADAMLFISGRIEFVPGRENQHKKSRCGAGTVMFAWGTDCTQALEKLCDRGIFMKKQYP